MQEDIISLRNQFLGQILDAEDQSDVERIKSDYFGKNGKLTKLIKSIKDLPEDERKQAGALINETKHALEQALGDQISKTTTDEKEWFDPTLPGVKPAIGHKHLVSSAIEEITDIFTRIGFTRTRYPEVEWDWYAFGSLNFPPEHPARDEWETFWVDAPADKKMGDMLLTPHTSSGQVREMERLKSIPPIRMINIGKTYRRQSDVSHTPMFHQFEGLVVDEGISISHLKGTLDYFAKTYFGEGRITRLRPYDFVFTEPSFEVDISCGVCDGKGCKLCKQGWLEIGGAGMVHPNVLKSGGIDPKKFTGFAFGWGVERVLMMRSGIKIDDLRLIYSTDLRFLTQF